jgi:hypothetical protein
MPPSSPASAAEVERLIRALSPAEFLKLVERIPDIVSVSGTSCTQHLQHARPTHVGRKPNFARHELLAAMQALKLAFPHSGWKPILIICNHAVITHGMGQPYKNVHCLLNVIRRLRKDDNCFLPRARRQADRIRSAVKSLHDATGEITITLSREDEPSEHPCETDSGTNLSTESFC